jgi:hypothetical protein
MQSFRENSAEADTVNGAGTMGPQAGIVFRCRIALVFVKAVGWIGLRIGYHQPISRDLGQD